MSPQLTAMLKSMRPPFLLLTPICLLVGVAAAAVADKDISMYYLALVMIAGLCAHISVNSLNEYFDFRSGLDKITEKTPFSGGSGSLVVQPQATQWVLSAGILSLLAAIGIGLYLALTHTLMLFGLGVLGVIIIVAYTPFINRAPLLCLIAPGLAFGPLFVLGAYISVAPTSLSLNSDFYLALWLSLVPFFLVNNLLLLNQIPDVNADREMGRRTFPIVYGIKNTIRLYGLFVALTALTIVFGVMLWDLSALTLIALLPLCLGVIVYRGLNQWAKRHEHPISTTNISTLTPLLGKNVACVLASVLVYGITLLISSI